MSTYALFLCAMAPLIYSVMARNACCSCDSFSADQEKQLVSLLKEEAVSLRKGMQLMCPKKASKWQNLTASGIVSFGAKGNKPGQVTIRTEGFLAAIKLVYVQGSVTCNTSGSHSSRWGCSTGTSPLGTFITIQGSRRIVFPRHSTSPWYDLPGFEPDSPVLVFHDFAHPEFVQKDQVLQVWYGEDLINASEENNEGETSVEVHAWYL